MIRPEEAWDKERGDLCEQFIESAQRHNFRNAYTFTMVGGQAMRAYGVGRCVFDGKPYEGWQWPTFLCEDNELRISRRPATSHSTPPYGYKNGELREVSRPGISHVTPGYFSRGTKSVTIGYSNEWGTHLGRRMHVSQVNPWQQEWFFPDRTPITGEVVSGVKFRETPLEDVIEAHDTALNLSATTAWQIESGKAMASPLLKKIYSHLLPGA